MKKKKNIIIIIISLVVVLLIAGILYILLNDKNKLTVAERNWVNESIGTIQNINVINNVNVFGMDGSGVFYDFLESFEKEYELSINPITFNEGNNPNGITLNEKKEYLDTDIIFYTDHYVLVSKKSDIIAEETNLNGKTIGILATDLTYVSKYLKKATNVSFTQFDSKDELLAYMDGDDAYIIVPLMDYLDVILSKDYHVVYHFSDIKKYLTLSTTDDKLSSVLTKYYNKWQSNFYTTYNKNLFQVFTTNMNITDTEVDSMQSISYNYGFVNSSPYEVITGGKYGGIIAVYLSKFSQFADIEFNFVKYKNYNDFTRAIKDKKVDLYFNYYNFTDDFYQTDGINIEYAIALPKSNNMVIKSIYSLINETVYVQENSKIYDYVKSIDGIDVKTFSNQKELFKLNKKDAILVIDRKTFDYYSDSKLDNYSLRYNDYILNDYTFKVRTNSALYKLIDKYIDITDESEMIVEGLLNHEETIKSGTLITTIAEYILYIIVIVATIIFIIFKRSKKITIARKIKKDDKMKFIDQLTSLKNRNFLNENIETWNNNTIYPQTVIVVDLNKVQEINDQFGYNEGDKQIKAMANVLVKTQLDNSEVMRTDGNEFVIYLVGYNQKQISNYIFKLNKEVKKLPYDFGAEFGFSMILDDIKTIEDALNEAVDDMKKSKENKANDEA